MSERPVRVKVEFYGIPRQRAGVAFASACGPSLADALTDLENQFPALADACVSGGRLQSGITANLGGQRFVTDPNTELHEGDVLLILSADAGG